MSPSKREKAFSDSFTAKLILQNLFIFSIVALSILCFDVERPKEQKKRKDLERTKLLHWSDQLANLSQSYLQSLPSSSQIQPRNRWDRSECAQVQSLLLLLLIKFQYSTGYSAVVWMTAYRFLVLESIQWILLRQIFPCIFFFIFPGEKNGLTLQSAHRKIKKKKKKSSFTLMFSWTEGTFFFDCL